MIWRVFRDRLGLWAGMGGAGETRNSCFLEGWGWGQCGAVTGGTEEFGGESSNGPTPMNVPWSAIVSAMISNNISMDPGAFYTQEGFPVFPMGAAPLRKFQCPYCFKTLSSKQNYKEHTYIHTGEKPFKCTEPGCEESFRQGSQLSVHRKMHRQVLKLQSRASIQIPKVPPTQLTDMLYADLQRSIKPPASSSPGASFQVLPDIGVKEVRDVKLPSTLFFVE